MVVQPRRGVEAICCTDAQTQINTVFPSPACGGTKESVTPCAEKSYAKNLIDCFTPPSAVFAMTD